MPVSRALRSLRRPSPRHGRGPGAVARQFVDVGHLDGRRHVMVDGAPREHTVCTLSHWPGTPTPRAVWADLSAQIVLEAMRRPDVVPANVGVVTVDHHDVDGVISVALLCDEGLAGHREMLVEAARVGDFGVVNDRRAARVAFALEAILDEGSSSPVHRSLSVLPELAADPCAFENLWKRQDDAFDAACAALADGWATIEERPEHDLAVVRVARSDDDARRASWAGAALHNAAVYSSTSCLRVATIAGDRYELRYRYESWVRLVSRRPRPRVDLSAAARELNDAEPDGAPWTFDGVGAITPALGLERERRSALAPEDFLEVVCRHLEELDRREPAFDPYR